MKEQEIIELTLVIDYLVEEIFDLGIL